MLLALGGEFQSGDSCKDEADAGQPWKRGGISQKKDPADDRAHGANTSPNRVCGSNRQVLRRETQQKKAHDQCRHRTHREEGPGKTMRVF